jgi:hypothetical protein
MPNSVTLSFPRDKESCPNQGTYIGDGDVGEKDFQQTIEDGVVSYVVRSSPSCMRIFAILRLSAALSMI